MLRERIYDSDYTEKLYVFSLLDYIIQKNIRPDHSSPYYTELRQEIVRSIDERGSSADFWHIVWRQQSEQLMRAAGLPEDFREHGIDEAFEIIEATMNKRSTSSASDKSLLENCLKLADEHRKVCEGADCTVQLSLLLTLLNKAGIEVPKDLVSRFM